MPHESAPLKNKLLFAMGTLFITTLLMILSSASYINNVSTKNQNIIKETVAQIQSLREAQVSFRMQVQEWKNILLRSHNKVLGERYRKQFHDRQSEVHEQLNKLTDNSSNSEFTNSVMKLKAYFKTMNEDYAKALETFDSEGIESQAKVDSNVRGIDRAFNDHITSLIILTEKEEQQALKQAEEDISSTILKASLIFGSIELMAIFLVMRYAMGLLRAATIAETEALKSSEDLRITLESIGDAVIATDANGNVTRMNPVAENLTGWTNDEASGKPLPEVFNIINALTREKAENPFTKVMATGEVVGLANHTALLSKDGKEYQIADSGAPIHDINRKIVGVVLVFRDVTKEYELQDRLNHSQKMDAIGQLAGGVAHDFNNMLGAILGAADVMGRRLEDEKAKKFHGIIVNCAERASSLVDKLLAFARKQPESSTKVDVHQILSDTIAILKNTIDKKIDIKLNANAEKCSVIGDPSQLQSIFINLGINASHAMPEGGKISISTSVISKNEQECEENSFQIFPGEFIEITFSDTGCGISKENIGKIFEPFFTTKDQGEGTGLGLSAALGTVHQHQGAITVESEEGKGTTFKVIIPLAKNAQKHESKHSIEQEGSGRILVIDDEIAMLATAQAILEDLGYEVELAEDGQMGLDIFKSNSDMFDLVLLDMIMPKMNGRECFFELRKIRPDSKIVITSGFALEKDVNDIKEAGLSGFVKKPYRSAALSEIVHDVLKNN